MVIAKCTYQILNLIGGVLVLFFLCQSLDISLLPGHVTSFDLEHFSTYTNFTNFTINTHSIALLHGVFVGVWFIAILLLRNFLKSKINGLIATVIILLLMPFILINGVIHITAFDFLFVAVFLNLIVNKELDSIIKTGLIAVTTFYWVAFGSEYYLSLLFILVLVYTAKSTKLKIIFAASYIISLGLTLFIYGADILSLIHPIQYELFAAFKMALEINVLELGMSLLILIWSIVLIRLLSKNQLNNPKLILAASCLILFFLSVNTVLLFTVVSVLIIRESRVLQSLFEKSRFSQGAIYLIIPFCLAGLFNIQDGNLNWKLGLDEKYDSIYTISKEIEIPFFIYNNSQSSEELNFFFPEATSLYQKMEKKDINEEIIEDCTQDILKWIDYKSTNDVKALFVNLKNEKVRHLEFLGSRIGDGEWALIVHDEGERALLIRKEPQFQEIIDKYEIRFNIALNNN
ncbi:MAG: hypothetical protein ACJA0U_000563 [Salibacteraceae bacterium]|jgi:hypothetical protein